MNCTHSTASITTGGGGIPEALRQLASAQAAIGIDIQVVGFDDGWQPLPGWPGNNPLGLIPTSIPGFPWATRFRHALVQSAPDILHTHGLWLQPSVVGPRFARSRRIPWLVSPHGMLDPWSLANSSWKKRIASFLFENLNLRGAACLHALCQSEAESMRAFGLRNPIAVIPNGVELPETSQQILISHRAQSDMKTLLFLGRLHPKKGLSNALRAWSEGRGRRSEVGGREDWQFVIAGWDQGGHEAELKHLCHELGLAYAETPATLFTDNGQRTTDHGASVIFTGPAFGEAKDLLLRQASAFILPSFSEGLPMSILEAWAYCLPVVMTDACNLPEGITANAAHLIVPDVTSISQCMSRLLGSPLSTLETMGTNGRALVERQFVWPRIAASMKNVYGWLLGNNDQPECVSG